MEYKYIDQKTKESVKRLVEDMEANNCCARLKMNFVDFLVDFYEETKDEFFREKALKHLENNNPLTVEKYKYIIAELTTKKRGKK